MRLRPLPDKMECVKVKIPAAICFAAPMDCCWEMYRSRHRSILEEDRVAIPVRGPNGTIIEPVGPAPTPPAR